MKIAIEGCAHGELEKIYDTIQGIEKAENFKVDLLLCCGDFQSTRNMEDLQTMAVPKKYQDICSFYKYYSGELQAPMLTIFIGGNHEASNYLQELPYGGWVAQNIYYLGYAGVVNINGIRLAGISGIYKGHDFLKGHHEFSPYTDSTRISVYHVRQLEVFRLKQLSGEIDIFMSHDWPKGIYNYGNKAQLARFKPHFKDEMEKDQLGSRPCEDLLKTLQPSLWFSAHLHCQFAAVVPHLDTNASNTPDQEENSEEKVTKFLALDKCLPKRRFLQLIDLEAKSQTSTETDLQFEYDLEWLTVLYLTNHLISVKQSNSYMPGPRGSMNGERFCFTPTEEEKQHVLQKMGGNLNIPLNFCRTVAPYDPQQPNTADAQQPQAVINPQCTQFCDLLGIDDPLSLAMLIGGHELSHSSILDTSSHNSTGISYLEDDDEVNEHKEATPVKDNSLNSGLKLPKPTQSIEKENDNFFCQNPDELQLDDDVDLQDEKEETNVPENVSNVDNDSKPIENIETTPAVKSDNLTATPPIKKFKRRNQNLYQETENE